MRLSSPPIIATLLLAATLVAPCALADSGDSGDSGDSADSGLDDGWSDYQSAAESVGDLGGAPGCATIRAGGVLVIMLALMGVVGRRRLLDGE